jgi:hypothetical protein
MLGEGVGVGVGAGDDPQAVQRGCRQYVSPAAALAHVGPLLPFSSSPQAVTTKSTGDRRRTPPSSHASWQSTRCKAWGSAHVLRQSRDSECSHSVAIIYRVRAYRVYNRVARNVDADCTCSCMADRHSRGHLHCSCCTFALIEGHSLLLVTAVALFLLLYDCIVFVQARRLKQDRPNKQASLTRASPHPSSGLLAQPAHEL